MVVREALESSGRRLRVPDGVLDFLVAEVVLNRQGVMSLIGEFVQLELNPIGFPRQL